MENLKKDMARLTSKDEVNNRINILFTDISTKLEDRPTIEYFKKCLHAYDLKISCMQGILDDTVEKLETTQKDQDDEII